MRRPALDSPRRRGRLEAGPARIPGYPPTPLPEARAGVSGSVAVTTRAGLPSAKVPVRPIESLPRRREMPGLVAGRRDHRESKVALEPQPQRAVRPATASSAVRPKTPRQAQFRRGVRAVQPLFLARRLAPAAVLLGVDIFNLLLLPGAFNRPRQNEVVFVNPHSRGVAVLAAQVRGNRPSLPVPARCQVEQVDRVVLPEAKVFQGRRATGGTGCRRCSEGGRPGRHLRLPCRIRRQP